MTVESFMSDDLYKDPLSLFSVKGRTAVITGATGAFGAMAAKVLAGAGANVVICASNAAALKKVAAECEALGGNAEVVAKRPSSEQNCAAIVDAAVDRFNGIDILVVLEVVIRHPVPKLRGVEVCALQPLLCAGDRHARSRVDMHHAMGPRDCAVNGRVDDEARRICRIRRGRSRKPVQAHFHQVVSSDFAVMQPERIDQERVGFTRDSNADVVVDKLIPPEHGEDPVGGG
jgi:hypothetical protein